MVTCQPQAIFSQHKISAIPFN